jgi:hypothetical protein
MTRWLLGTVVPAPMKPNDSGVTTYDEQVL